MKKIGMLGVLTLTMSGCVSQDMFVKQNVTYDKYERQFVGCSTLAAQKVPTNTQIGWAPYVGIYSSDTNAKLRMQNFEICMRDKGYQKVTIPFCSGEAQKVALEQSKSPSNRNRKMKIVPQSCYILRPDGSSFLYSPAAG